MNQFSPELVARIRKMLIDWLFENINPLLDKPFTHEEWEAWLMEGR